MSEPTMRTPRVEERRFPSAPPSARAAREFVTQHLRRAGAPAAQITDFELIVSELVANSVQHGGGQDITVQLLTGDHGATLTVSSGLAATTPPLDPSRWGLAPADHGSGRGLGIVRRLAHDVHLAVEGGWLKITCAQRR